MVSSLHSGCLGPPLQISSFSSTFQHLKIAPSRNCISRIKCGKSSSSYVTPSSSSSSARLPLQLQLLRKACVPLAASLVIFWTHPAQAGFLSGITGIESVPGPKLPNVDFLNSYIEDSQKKYTENDERIKSSPIIKELLERSKQNKEKNKQAILDKYCLRGAEWGVGDCSTQGMTEDEKDAFIALLKKKAGVE